MTMTITPRWLIICCWITAASHLHQSFNWNVLIFGKYHHKFSWIVCLFVGCVSSSYNDTVLGEGLCPRWDSPPSPVKIFFSLIFVGQSNCCWSVKFLLVSQIVELKDEMRLHWWDESLKPAMTGESCLGELFVTTCYFYLSVKTFIFFVSLLFLLASQLRLIFL